MHSGWRVGSGGTGAHALSRQSAVCSEQRELIYNIDTDCQRFWHLLMAFRRIRKEKSDEMLTRN